MPATLALLHPTTSRVHRSTRRRAGAPTPSPDDVQAPARALARRSLALAIGWGLVIGLGSGVPWNVAHAARAAGAGAGAAAGDAESAPLPAVPPFTWHGLDPAGRASTLAPSPGQVLLVYRWRADCAVCLSSLAELRTNAQAWAGRPFRLVLLNEDATPDAARRYDALLRQTLPRAMHLDSLWVGPAEPSVAGPLRPAPRSAAMADLIDTRGSVVAHFEGRIPAEAWNTIADLLP